jgi:hypothetical protein
VSACVCMCVVLRCFERELLVNVCLKHEARVSAQVQRDIYSVCRRGFLGLLFVESLIP